MIACEVELPNGERVRAGFDRVPIPGEQVELADDPQKDGERWPHDFGDGNLFEVATVRWTAREPGAVARPLLLLSNR